MLVQNSVYRNTYLTDGVNKDFYFSFPILESSQVLVQTSLLTDTDVVTTVDPSQYTVTGVGQTTGGHISFTTAPPAGSRLALTLNMPITQLYQYAELDSFPAKSHEDALAKLTLICQQTREQISRAITIPPTSSKSPQDVLQDVYASIDDAKNLVDTVQQWLNEVGTEVGDHSYVTPSGATTARTLADRFADAINVKDFGAVGDGIHDDTTAFDMALNSRIGVTVNGIAGETYYLKNTVFCRTSDVTLDLIGASIITDNFQSPVFSLSVPNDIAVSPDNVTFKNIRAIQTATVVDIGGSTFYPASQPENWKVAALIHRGKGVGKTMTLENIYADNFINLVSNWGDWQDETVASGPLVMREIKTTHINFGLLDNGADYLEIDGWDDKERVEIQIADGKIMPSHTIYSINHKCQKSNYFIRNVSDRNTIHGSCIKLRQVSGFQITNVVGVASPGLIDLLNCSNGVVMNANLSDPSYNPSLTLSHSAYWCYGCTNISWISCNADCAGEKKLVRAGTSNETGSAVKNSCIYFEGNANFTDSGYVVYMQDEGGGISFNISITSSAPGTFGILRDSGSGSAALENIQINIKSVFASAASTLLFYFLSTAGAAQIYYNPVSLINISSLTTAGTNNAANVYTMTSGKYQHNNQTVDLTSSDTGVCEFIANRTSATRKGVIKYSHANDQWIFISNGATRSTLDVYGFKTVLPTTITLDTDRYMGFEAVSNTQLNLVYRGSDGVTRRAAITVS